MESEAGGHRLQRVPPTEKRGRVHSSTVTVAVLEEGIREPQGAWGKRALADFRVDWFNGTTKAGGQHHQKNATCCRLTHIPTGLVRTSQTRSRENSQKEAMAAMLEELDRQSALSLGRERNGIRKEQVGTGERAGRKRRTWRFQEDVVLDHETGKRARASEAIGGKLEGLWR